MSILAVNSVATSTGQSAPITGQAAASQSAEVESAIAEAGSGKTEVVAQVQEQKPSQVPARAASTMRFSLGGDDGKQVIIEIYDAEKGTLVRTIPYQEMSEKSKGMLLSVTA